MSISVRIKCDKCDRSVAEIPVSPRPEQVSLAYQEMRERGKRDGWEVSAVPIGGPYSPDLCPDHASSPLVKLINPVIEKATGPTIALAKSVAKALEEKYILVPKDAVIEGTSETDFYTGHHSVTRILRYRAAQ